MSGIGGDDRHARCPHARALDAEPPPGGATDRRSFLAGSLVVLAGASPVAAALAGCGDGDGRGMGPGGMRDMMSGDARSGRMMRDMRVIRRLLADHERIRRTVESLPNGVRTTTVSSNPEVAELIGTHVRQMKARVEEGRPIRRMDPVFREIFEHHAKIDIDVEDIPEGVRVVETSDDPQVVLLIEQHARRAVSEFVAEGMSRARRPTPLPEGYRGGSA